MLYIKSHFCNNIYRNPESLITYFKYNGELNIYYIFLSNDYMELKLFSIEK